jgi:AI-2 transport protein TqsA
MESSQSATSRAMESMSWPMKDSSYPLLLLLQGAAYAVIILWGVRALSELVGPLLLGLMLAYAVVPFPKWLMHRFKLSKSMVTSLMAVVLCAAGLLSLFTISSAIAYEAARLPIYEQRLSSLYEQVMIFMSAHGIEPAGLSIKNVLTLERISAISVSVLPKASAIITECLLIFLMAFLFLMEMVHEIGSKPGPIAEILLRHGFYSRTYVVVTAKSAAINAFINFVFLFAMGVDTPFLWSFLYFFLNFIPTFGFSIALIPPTFVTLLMHGWQRALLVAGGLILTNLIVDNVVTPIFAKRAMSISFLEITLSLVGWAFLLGLPGAIVAVPLTLALKEFVAKNWGTANQHTAVRMTSTDYGLDTRELRTVDGVR